LPITQLGPKDKAKVYPFAAPASSPRMATFHSIWGYLPSSEQYPAHFIFYRDNHAIGDPCCMFICGDWRCQLHKTLFYPPRIDQ